MIHVIFHIYAFFTYSEGDGRYNATALLIRHGLPAQFVKILKAGSLPIQPERSSDGAERVADPSDGVEAAESRCSTVSRWRMFWRARVDSHPVDMNEQGICDWQLCSYHSLPRKENETSYCYRQHDHADYLMARRVHTSLNWEQRGLNGGGGSRRRSFPRAVSMEIDGCVECEDAWFKGWEIQRRSESASSPPTSPTGTTFVPRE